MVNKTSNGSGSTLGWRNMLAVVLGVCLIVWITHQTLTARYTDATRAQAELRLSLYAGNLLAELRQSAIVPQLLVRDPTLIEALSSQDTVLTSQRLATYVDEVGAAGLKLIDRFGNVVASTDRTQVGDVLSTAPQFADAVGMNETIFAVDDSAAPRIDFTYSRNVDGGATSLGVIAVEIDLASFERAWAGVAEAMLVKDGSGEVILATEPAWRGLTEENALRTQRAKPPLDHRFQATASWINSAADTYVNGAPVLRVEQALPFQNWTMVSYVPYAGIRERVFGVIAIELMSFAFLLSIIFYIRGRRSNMRAQFFQAESEELRELNERLQNEIAERKRVEEDLAVAEQTLEQSSKLAALGEMSAAVSHELNQPLAAMKTYLAGARLLLTRQRPDEALSSFSRIDDLIERMSAITKQLKSYARKGQEVFTAVDMGDAIVSCLSMMEPQLRERHVRINPILPSGKVQVLGDRMRIEQVLVNLVRNALDATKTVDDPQVDIILSAGETATVMVRDNGPGIEDLDSLFEPFYTTKQPGDGVGLGLAISSGIVNDLGGRLTARNGRTVGAVFEMQLPILDGGVDVEAAE